MRTHVRYHEPVPERRDGSDQGFRWKLAGEDCAQPRLFSDEELYERHVGIGEYRGLEFLHVDAKRIINAVPARSRMGFRYTINAYRGCSHACTFCFARPTHEYLGLNISNDFESKIVVKVNAVEKLRAELRSPRWNGDLIAMGTNTDPYQRAEGKYHLTRGIVEALGEAANPFSILTKGTLILRDVDVLRRAAARTDVRCAFSIATLDENVWRTTEPGTPHPRRRVEAVRKLNEAGIPTGVLIAPIIPGLSDRPEQLEALSEACLEAGAISITPLALHLRPGVKEHFLAFLDVRHPALGAELRARYGLRSYLPAGQQEQITRPVRIALGARTRPLTGPAPPEDDRASANMAR